MSLPQDALELIGTPSGALVYHLVTLFAIQLILGVAIGHWQRHRDGRAARLLSMSIGVFLARALLMLIALVGRVGLISSDAVIPPLERFLHLTTVALAVWAFLRLSSEYPRAGTAVLLSLGAVAAGTYGAFAMLWPGVEAMGRGYNGYWQGQVWGVSTTAVLAVALIASFVKRGADTGWLACLLGLWLAGQLLQLAAPVAEANTPGWVRLADLAALPLLAGLVYRRALSEVSPAPGEADNATEAVVSVLRAVQAIEDGEALRPALQRAACSLSHALGADMVAVGLLRPGSDDAVQIVALYALATARVDARGHSLSVSDHPLLTNTLRDGRPEQAEGDRGTPEVVELYRDLGLDAAGPLLVQPMTTEDGVVGVLLAGSPVSERQWTPRDREVLQTLADPLASAVAGRERLSGRQQEALEEARSEAQRMAKRAERLEASLREQRRRADELVTRMRLREKETASQKDTSEALALWEDEVRELAVARDALRAQVRHWREKAEALAETKAGLEGQLKTVSRQEGRWAANRFEGVMLSDEEGRIALASPGFLDFLGKTPAELIDRPLRGLFDETAWKSAVTRLLSGSDRPAQACMVTVTAGDGLVRLGLSVLAGPEHGSGGVAAVLQRSVERREPAPELLNLTAIVEETLPRFSEAVDEKRLKVHTDLRDDLPPVCADRDDLCQVIHTLISNAVLASIPGTTVDVVGRAEEGKRLAEDRPAHVLFSVTDTAGGIAAEDQPYVFQRFCGASNPLVEGLGEPGSGMHVARALVEANGGRMWVESEMDVGSTFSFLLPTQCQEGLPDPEPGSGVSEAER